jgi:hypothetical protein
LRPYCDHASGHCEFGCDHLRPPATTPLRCCHPVPSPVRPRSVSVEFPLVLPAGHGCAGDQVGDGCGGVVLQGGDGVGVDVQGHRHGGVAEPLADDLAMHACLEGQGGVGVAQVVEADMGAVALRRPRACWSGDLRPGSDAQGQFVERDGQPPGRRLLNGQLVVSPPKVLRQRMPGDDDSGATVLLEPTHRPQARLQPSMVGLNPVVGVLLGAMPGCWHQVLEHDRAARSVTTSTGSNFVVAMACQSTGEPLWRLFAGTRTRR